MTMPGYSQYRQRPRLSNCLFKNACSQRLPRDNQRDFQQQTQLKPTGINSVKIPVWEQLDTDQTHPWQAVPRQVFTPYFAGPRSAVGSASDSRARGPGFDTRSGHILSFLLPLTKDGQLSVTGECMCTKYWLTA